MECIRKETNKRRCNCSYPCDKKGVCCECVAYHRSMGQLPACYFPTDAEKTYDRSISYFVQLHKEGRV